MTPDDEAAEALEKRRAAERLALLRTRIGEAKAHVAGAESALRYAEQGDVTDPWNAQRIASAQAHATLALAVTAIADLELIGGYTADEGPNRAARVAPDERFLRSPDRGGD